MAIYHLTINNVSRGKGKSAIAAAAYRSGQRLWNEREKTHHDYSNKQDIIHTEILAPSDVPLWMLDREQLWNAIEAIEKRKDSRLCKEVEFALPAELSEAQQIELARTFAQRFVARGLVADLGVHHDGEGNPHAHILITTRAADSDGFAAKKMRGLDHDKFVLSTRKAWSDLLNATLEQAGIAASVDHRTLKAQGIDRTPQVHHGVKGRAMHERGKEPQSKVVTYRSKWGNERNIDYRDIDTGTRVERGQETEQMTRNYDELLGVQRQIADLRDRKPDNFEEERAQDHHMFELHAKREHLISRVDRDELERGFGMGAGDQRELLDQWDRENRPLPDKDGRPVHPRDPKAIRDEIDTRSTRPSDDQEAYEGRYVRPTVPEEQRSYRETPKPQRAAVSAERKQLDRDIDKIRSNRFLNDDQKAERLRPLMARSVDLMREEREPRLREERKTERTREELSGDELRERWDKEERALGLRTDDRGSSDDEVRDREDRDFDELEREYERSRGVDGFNGRDEDGRR